MGQREHLSPRRVPNRNRAQDLPSFSLPPCVWEVMGLIPVGDSDVFFVPRLCHVDKFTFHISLPCLKFTIFIHLHRTFLTLLCSRKWTQTPLNTYSSTPVESLWSVECHCTGRNSTLPIARPLDSSSWWSNNIWRLTLRKSLTASMEIRKEWTKCIWKQNFN